MLSHILNGRRPSLRKSQRRGVCLVQFLSCLEFARFPPPPHNLLTLVNEADVILKNSVVAEVQVCDYIF